jgi:hypothetical protein
VTDDAAKIAILRSLVRELDEPLFVRCPLEDPDEGWVAVEVWGPRLRKIARLLRQAKTATGERRRR